MKSSINIKLGEKIKTLRTKRNMTQENLADAMDTSYKYIQRIEGKTPPDIRLTTVEKLAKALNTTTSKLLNL